MNNDMSYAFLFQGPQDFVIEENYEVLNRLLSKLRSLHVVEKYFPGDNRIVKLFLCQHQKQMRITTFYSKIEEEIKEIFSVADAEKLKISTYTTYKIRQFLISSNILYPPNQIGCAPLHFGIKPEKECYVCLEKVHNLVTFVCCSHGSCHVCLVKILERDRNATCGICRVPIIPTHNDPSNLYRTFVLRHFRGKSCIGVITDIHIVTAHAYATNATTMYLVLYDDKDKEHLTYDQIRECRITDDEVPTRVHRRLLALVAASYNRH